MTINFLETLPISDPVHERSLQASKWLYVRMLLDPAELQDLWAQLEPIFLMNTSKVCQKHQLTISPQQFLSVYEEYYAALKQGNMDLIQKYKRQCCWSLSKTLDPFYLMQLQQERFLIKLKTPAIRMQHFHFHYLEEQNEFILAQHTKQSISWGLEWSFPQFYQDPNTCAPHEVLKDTTYPNTQIFKTIQKWAREYTLPVPFIIHHHKKVAPFRLGKKCFNWINQYPDLRDRGLSIYADRSHHHR